jgi:hypothetical protein
VPAPVQQQSVNPVASWRVAIIDDVYAGPTLDAVKNGLAEFCAEASEDDSLAQALNQHTHCDFTNISNVTDAEIIALYNCRDQLTDTNGQLEKLFLEFNQRHHEVSTIEQNLREHGFADTNIKTFQSIEDLFSGEPFQLVFLDLLLAKGKAESQAIAKQIYEKFKAFILLMSNSPITSPQVEGFRRETRLLNGFFGFRAKSDLCDLEKFRIQIDTLPKDPEVCHAIHKFVMALEDALGGPIEEPPMNEVGTLTSVLPQFMHTLRTLGLHDYALLCELTLRNEGHPLGDYMMRLLGAHLLAQLLSHSKVKDAIAALDKLRFTEFLPFGDERSPSFHRMYADSTTEAITEPWGPHPWSVVSTPASSGTAVDEVVTDESGEGEGNTALITESASSPGQESQPESEILTLLEIEDDGQELPYVQLGDLLIKDENALVFAVLNAACDLQFVPPQVHKGRERLRDDTVLLVPARLRAVGTSKSINTMAGLVEWNGNYYCIEWVNRKLLGIPHCAIRKLLQDRGYLHHRRLQTAHALELQQAVLSNLSRIGLEVRPPFPRDIRITLYGRQPDQSFVKLDDAIEQGGLLFHGRKADQRVLVLRRSAFFRFAEEMKKHAERIETTEGIEARLKTNLPAAAKAFMSEMAGLKLPIEIPASADPKAIQLVNGSGKKQPIKQIALRFGEFEEAPVTSNKDLMFCLSAEQE